MKSSSEMAISIAPPLLENALYANLYHLFYKFAEQTTITSEIETI